ncbi:hypothetical protein [uncultured Shewanella sp.]|uniref:hypothetical protein n=1 Tax=uncultured Shewanella sp. TaxID=173975 RepID=UPI00261A4500|nr:hypothetical protein [uncultured Shewanella sp.]
MLWGDFVFYAENTETIVAVMFCVALWIVTGLNATTIALTSWTSGNFVMERISQLYKYLFKIYGNPEILQHLWYLTWVFFYSIMLFFIWKMMKKYQLAVTPYSKMIAVVISFLSLIQVMRYADRFVFGTDILAMFYQWGVFFLNIIPVVVIMVSFKIAFSKPKY